MITTTIFRNTFEGPKFITLTENDTVFVGRCGSGRTVFGEKAHLSKILKNHLVFTTESGAQVKTNLDAWTVGKANNAGYFVALRDMTNEENVIYQKVHYWNSKKLCMEYK